MSDSDSDSSFVVLSSVGSDLESFVYVGEDSLSTDSGEDLFGNSEDELEKVVDDIRSFDLEDDECCDSGQQLEKSDDDSCSLSTESDEVLLDCSRSQINGGNVATNEFHGYPCKRIGHVCGDDCYVTPVEKKARENSEISDVSMEYVLPLLPAKTLCKFKSVEKRWDKWISGPFFAHRQACSFQDICGFICQLPGEKPSFVSLKRDVYGIPNPSLDFLPGSVAVRTTCNGLVCCESCDGENTYYICNPVNKQWALVPKFYEPESGTESPREVFHGLELVLGLVFSPTVLGFEEHFQLVCAYSYPDQPVKYFDIYSSKSGFWKRCETQCCETDAQHLTGPGFYLKGKVYWETLAAAVLVFDVKEEQYGILPTPRRRGPQGVIAEMNGEICYIMPFREYLVPTLEIYGDMDMKLKITIPLVGDIFAKPDGELRVLACVNNNVVFLLLGKEVIAYNVKLEKTDIVHVDSWRMDGYASFLPYVNSLVEVHQP